MKYIILSLKHGTHDEPVFWRGNNAGYTSSPFAAGIYTEDQVKGDLDYYNDGLNSIAIPLTDPAMKTLGFKCQYDPNQLKHFLQKAKS